jgi:hypothetical protein
LWQVYASRGVVEATEAETPRSDLEIPTSLPLTIFKKQPPRNIYGILPSQE